MEAVLRETYRYLGLGGHEPDAATRALAEDCLAELKGVITPRQISRTFPLALTGTRCDLTCFAVESANLAKNLAGCERGRLFAATLGPGPDRLLRKYGHLSPARSVVLQAASAALIEAYCDELNETWRKEAKEEGFFLRPRFSPGYGDFPLESQRLICEVLRTGKTVGITLTDALLMMPSKSVTAVIGMAKTDAGCLSAGCEVCTKTDCAFRRNR